jgi:hypothetical protein
MEWGRHARCVLAAVPPDTWNVVKRVSAALALVSATLAPSAARAADWPIVTGTEEGAPDTAIRPFGFLQVVGEGTFGSRVQGLQAPALQRFDGRYAAFNTLPGSEATAGLSIRRARPSVRGSVPFTKKKVTYFFSTEFGKVGLTRVDPAVIADASVTFSYIPGARIRVGQFKLPLMDEVVESNPLAAEQINFTQTAVQLLAESRVENGKYTSGTYGFRDLGVSVFDSFQFGKVALSYQVMGSQGRMGSFEDDEGKDISGRVTSSWVFKGKPWDPHRQELSLFAWGLHGRRTQDGLSGDRNRSGIGAHLELEPVRFRAELVHAQGMIIAGPTPPFEGEPIVVAPYGEALGAYGQARVKLFGHFLIGLRYEELHRWTQVPSELRIFRTLTPGLEVQITPKIRLMVNYEKRWIEAPHGSADAKRIVETVGDRLIAQVGIFVP